MRGFSRQCRILFGKEETRESIMHVFTQTHVPLGDVPQRSRKTYKYSTSLRNENSTRKLCETSLVPPLNITFASLVAQVQLLFSPNFLLTLYISALHDSDTCQYFITFMQCNTTCTRTCTSYLPKQNVHVLP